MISPCLPEPDPLHGGGPAEPWSGPPADELISYGLLAGLGGLRVGLALAAGEAAGAEVTVAMSMTAIGVAGLGAGVWAWWKSRR